jgi:membrane protease YdiL (CAAX protease family)
LPRPYQQLLRGPNLHWWRPLVGIAVVIGVTGVAVITIGTAFAALGPGADAGSADDGFDAWSVTPAGMLVTNLMLAALIPIAQLGVWAGFGWTPRWVGSVTGGIRWGWTVRCYLAVTVAMGAFTLATMLPFGGLSWGPEKDWAWLLLVVLISTPLQAAGEEYFFRGWICQTVGAMFARPVVGALIGGLLSTWLFALAHGQQDPWLFADRFVFGAIACYLAWRTGGLEAGIAMHGVNNIIVFAITIASGQLEQSLNASESDPLSLGVDVVSMLLTAAVLLWLARRLRPVRLFVPPRPLLVPARW